MLKGGRVIKTEGQFMVRGDEEEARPQAETEWLGRICEARGRAKTSLSSNFLYI